ncbi:MAG TPA: hypothetical protein VFN89_02135 [Solirubrobacterales bacterium]|nr:hypothetical protein [Solirubrobacterales bacterium]
MRSIWKWAAWSLESTIGVVVVEWLGLGEISRGLVEAIAVMAFFAAAAIPVTLSIAPASQGLLENTAQMGVVFVLAYVLEVVWLTPRLRGEDDYEYRLGALTGLGLAGTIGVLLAVLLAAHRAAGHANFLDDAGLACVATSLMSLAGVVIAHPLLVHEWERSAGAHDREEA